MTRPPVNMWSEPSAGSKDTEDAIVTDIPDNSASGRGKVNPVDMGVEFYMEM